MASLSRDTMYCSEQNLRYLDLEAIDSYIKLQTHEKMKTRAYKKEIGKHYNMTRIKEGSGYHYVCGNDRQLTHERTETRKQKGFEQRFEVYACSDCSGCPLKAECLYRYDEQKDYHKNKVMKINETWEKLKAKSHENKKEPAKS